MVIVDNDFLEDVLAVTEIQSYLGCGLWSLIWFMSRFWLGLVLYPMAFCYSLYSLIYNRHISYLGWVISSLYHVVFVMGFISMTPQLFLNAKLKSVAHLPWQTMVYKVLKYPSSHIWFSYYKGVSKSCILTWWYTVFQHIH